MTIYEVTTSIRGADQKDRGLWEREWIGADLEIKGGGQEPYLAKPELHTRRARTTRVQGKYTE